MWVGAGGQLGASVQAGVLPRGEGKWGLEEGASEGELGAISMWGHLTDGEDGAGAGSRRPGAWGQLWVPRVAGLGNRLAGYSDGAWSGPRLRIMGAGSGAPPRGRGSDSQSWADEEELQPVLDPAATKGRAPRHWRVPKDRRSLPLVTRLCSAQDAGQEGAPHGLSLCLPVGGPMGRGWSLRMLESCSLAHGGRLNASVPSRPACRAGGGLCTAGRPALRGVWWGSNRNQLCGPWDVLIMNHTWGHSFSGAWDCGRGTLGWAPTASKGVTWGGGA